jgi:hypothetical protein
VTLDFVPDPDNMLDRSLDQQQVIEEAGFVARVARNPRASYKAGTRNPSSYL